MGRRGGSRGQKKPSLYDLSRQSLKPEHKEAYAKELMGESDRAAALVAAAEVKSLFCRIFSCLSSRGYTEKNANYYFSGEMGRYRSLQTVSR